MNIQLTSLERLYRYTELTRNNENEMILTNWMMSISRMIENYLDRHLLVDTYTQYWDTIYSTDEYYVKSYPISSITSVKIDTTGDFSGSEQTLSVHDYHKGSYEDSILIDTRLETAKRGLKAVYVGGLADHATRSIFSVEDKDGDTMTIGNYVCGNMSGSWGIVKSISDTSIMIDVIQGYFEEGETITEKASFGGATVKMAESSEVIPNTLTISECTSRSLAEMYPDIVRACEMQVRYFLKHKDDFENTGTLQNGVSIRRSGGVYDLEPEVKAMLNTYRRLIYVA